MSPGGKHVSPLAGQNEMLFVLPLFWDADKKGYAFPPLWPDDCVVRAFNVCPEPLSHPLI
jgi:hypothetical protein